MQAKTNSARVSQSVRLGPAIRRTKQQVICKRGRARKEAPSSGLGRFYPIAFGPKHSIKVLSNLSGNKFINDLQDAYVNYYRLTHGVNPELNFYCESDSEGEQYVKLKNAFALLVDEDCCFQVDKDDRDNFFFVIYEEVDWPETWHMFEARTLINHLSTINEDVLQVFASFLKMFTKITGVDLWYQGEMSYALEFLEEQIGNLQGEIGDEVGEYDAYHNQTIAEIEECIEVYESGEAALWEGKIRNSCDWEPEELKEEILSLESNDPIIDLMLNGCDICMDKMSIHNYHFNPLDGLEYNGDGLHFEQQFAIVWDDSDLLTSEYREVIDNGANEGINVPYGWLIVDKNTSQLFKKDTWLIKIDKFFELACDIVRKIYADEQNNKTSGK